MDYKERIIDILTNKELTSEQKQQLETIFPELKESEDEKIRKELIDFFSRGAKCGSTTNNIPDKEIVAWLEKQGHDGKKWIYEDVYIKEKEQLIQDGIDEVLENPQKYGLEKQGERPKKNWSDAELEKQCE